MVAIDRSAAGRAERRRVLALRGSIASALLCLCAMARADGRSAASVFVYTDDDRLTVVHPAANVRARILEETHASARYEADVISAATVDVRTSASVRPFSEVRHGVSLGADTELTRTARLDASYAGSFSPDYETHGLSAQLAVDDDTRSHTMLLRVSGARDSVARIGDDEPVGSITAIGATLGLTSVLTEHAVGTLQAALERQAGYLESPYRFVPIESGSSDPAISLSVPERVPDARLRTAFEGGLRLAPLDHFFVRGAYRLHFDDWGVLGHTLRATISEAALEDWIFSAFAKLYQQRAASFYRGRYLTAPELPSLRTLDRELAATLAWSAGLRVERALGRVLDAELRVDASAELTRRRYERTPRLPERTSLVAGLSVSAEY